MAIKLGGGGGVSVPIGGDLQLLDTANTVTKGSEVFLRTGLTASSSTYPDAPVKSYINNGTLAAQSDYDTNISPWQGVTPAPNNGGSMADSTGELFVVTTSGYVNKFTSYGTTFVSSRNLRDGTVFPTTCTAEAISCVQYSTTSRAQGSNMPATNLRAFFSGDGGAGGVPAIAYLSNDLATHYGTYSLTAPTGYDWDSNKTYIKAMFVSPTQMVVVQSITNSYSLPMFRYPVPNLSSSSGTLAHQNISVFTSGLNNLWAWHPYLFPHSSNYTYVGMLQNNSGGVGRRLIYFVGTDNFGTNANAASYITSNIAYDTVGIGYTSTNPYRAPYMHGSHGLKYMTIGVEAAFSADAGNLSNNRIYTDLPFSSTGYRGYTFKDANTVYVGVTAENKAFAIHPTTNAVGTAIDMSSQAAPYRLAHHNNVLYNLNGTNIHTYSTTSNAFVSTIDISDKVSGTNAVGIAHDGSNLYVLDGSNSKIHKYNATGSSYVSFVTLSDTPHTSSTLVSLAVDSTNSVFYVTDDTNASLYALDGTAKVSSVTAGWEDSEVHNGHLVGMHTNSSTTTKIPTVDVVGNPSGSLGAVSTTYYRVS